MRRPAVRKTKREPSHSDHVQRQSARSTSAKHPLLDLQRSVGSHAVQRLINSHYIQAKLSVSSPGDPFEQEADRMADTVMRMPDRQARPGATISSQAQISRVSRKCDQCEEQVQRQPVEEEEEEEIVQGKVDQNAQGLRVSDGV